MHKILLDFELLTDYLVLVRRSDLVIWRKNEENQTTVWFAVPAEQRLIFFFF